jgi:hypothetical protein
LNHFTSPCAMLATPSCCVPADAAVLPPHRGTNKNAA